MWVLLPCRELPTTAVLKSGVVGMAHSTSQTSAVDSQLGELRFVHPYDPFHSHLSTDSMPAGLKVEKGVVNSHTSLSKAAPSERGRQRNFCHFKVLRTTSASPVGREPGQVVSAAEPLNTPVHTWETDVERVSLWSHLYVGGMECVWTEEEAGWFSLL